MVLFFFFFFLRVCAQLYALVRVLAPWFVCMFGALN